MTRPIGALALLFALSGSTALAAKPSGTANLEKQVARYERYFNKGQAAVASGAIPPHARIRTVGLKAAALAGVSASVGTMKITERGMEQKFLLGRASGSVGLQVGAGPEAASGRVFGEKGTLGRELLPRSQTTVEVGMVAGARASSREQATVFSPHFGWGIGKSLNATRAVGAPTRSAMLQRLEDGRLLVQGARQALWLGGDNPSVPKLVYLNRTLERLGALRGQIRAEKRELNRERRKALSNE